ACERNPKLSICHAIEDASPSLVTPPPLPAEVTKEASKWSRNSRVKDGTLGIERTSVGGVSKTKGYSCRRGGYRHSSSKVFANGSHCAKGQFELRNNRCYGIPYYPINEEGGVGVGVTSHIPFGSWGGGIRSCRNDYWSQNQEVGANWYEGKYGYKNGWSVPLVQSLGIEGGQHNVVSVPLDRRNMGKIMVDNGYGVGPYYGHNDHVGIDWKKGDVQHTFGVGSPFVGAGFDTGQAVSFPSIETFMRAGRK
ncbi:hypothetical protein OSTOST_16371, partial [Ostertagia ostertagi]